jgi:DNA-binding CsgD family transcriptional regulator
MAPAALLAPIPVEIAVGGAFIAAGVAAWRLRPANRMGLLMILAGIAWFGRDLARVDGETSNRAGELSLNLFLALVAHQVIVFPSGIPSSRLGRRLIASGYALAVGGYIVSEIFPSTNDVLAALAIPLLALIIFDVVERWLAATPPARRALEPILWAGPPVLVVAALSVAHDYLDVGSSGALDWLKLVYIALPLAFLIGVLRTTLHRTGIGDLVVELSDVASPKLVRDALARTLGDPSLELAYWLPEKNTFVDGEGQPVTPAEGDGRGVLELPGIAALTYDSSLQDDPALVTAAGAAARLALENARLQAELQAQLEGRRLAEGDQLRVDFITAPTQPGALAELTTRELEVLALLAEGRTDRGIASALYVTPKTVEAHVRSIFRKLDLPPDATMENRRVHAVLTFLRAR